MAVGEWTYLLDAADRIVDIGPGWYRFARANDAPELSRARVVGTLLWDHVRDAPTRRLLGRVLAHVRASGRAVTLPWRCDGPRVRRFMSLHAEPGPDGTVRITSTLRSERPHRVTLTVLDRRTPRDGDSRLPVCSWCNSIQVDGRWLDIAQASRLLRLGARPALPTLQHEVCPTCHAIVDRELAVSGATPERGGAEPGNVAGA